MSDTDLRQTISSLNEGPTDFWCKQKLNEYLLQIPIEWGKGDQILSEKFFKKTQTNLVKIMDSFG